MESVWKHVQTWWHVQKNMSDLLTLQRITVALLFLHISFNEYVIWGVPSCSANRFNYTLKAIFSILSHFRNENYMCKLIQLKQRYWSAVSVCQRGSLRFYLMHTRFLFGINLWCTVLKCVNNTAYVNSDKCCKKFEYGYSDQLLHIL